MDDIESDLTELSALPKGAYIGQLSISTLKDILPEQFLMRYDYDFLYSLKTTVMRLQNIAHFSEDFAAHSVLQELAVYLFVESAEFLMECMEEDMQKFGVSSLDIWKDWAFDLFDDMDIVTCLYSNDYLTDDHIYHFDHWMENQFYV